MNRAEIGLIKAESSFVRSVNAMNNGRCDLCRPAAIQRGSSAL
jgi:hypothetical protein